MDNVSLLTNKINLGIHVLSELICWHYNHTGISDDEGDGETTDID